MCFSLTHKSPYPQVEHRAVARCSFELKKENYGKQNNILPSVWAQSNNI
nr:MAG TPA: hypothetical protein [Caudoviricetes sp.]